MNFTLSMGQLWVAFCALYISYTVIKYKKQLFVVATPVLAALVILALLVLLSTLNKVAHEERTWDLYLLVLTWNGAIWLMFIMFGFRCGKRSG